MKKPSLRLYSIIFILAGSAVLSGCTVVKVVDTAASTAIGVTKGVAKGAVKVTGKAVDVVTPDKKNKDDE